MPCSNCGDDARTIIRDGDKITFTGSGTPTDPYVPHQKDDGQVFSLEVRDTTTVNLTLIGSGLPGDPLVLSADTSSASKLANLSDVAAVPGVSSGRVPMWIGSSATGRFELRTPGVRYTTRATRGDGLYQGEQIRETDTGGRFEWDGSQYIDIVPTSVAPSALDASVLQNKGTLDGSIDWNTLTSGSGIYRIQAGVNSGNNTPSGAYGYGTLVVVKSGNSVTQTYYTHQSGKIYYRTKWNDTDWFAWGSLLSSADVQGLANDRANGDANLQSQINSESGVRLQADNDLGTRIAQVQSEAANQRIYNTNGAGRICSGSFLVSNFTKDTNTGNYIGSAVVGLPSGGSAFNGVPNVVASAISTDSGGVTAQIENISATQFRCWVTRRNNFSTGVYFIAAGN